MAQSTYTSSHDRPPLTLSPESGLIQAGRTVLSIGFTAILLLYWPLVLPLLMPAFVVRVLRAGGHNISVSSAEGSATAAKAAWGRAVGAYCGFTEDPVALKLLPHVATIPGVPWGATVIKLWTLLLMFQWRVTRTLITDQLGAIARFPFLRVSLMRMQAREAFLDAMVQAFRARHPDGQLVILGAGYDTRCWRFGGGYELDAPGTQAAKQKAIQAAGLDPTAAKHVPVDFSCEPWLDLLCAAGFQRNRPACFVWSGVTLYLQPAAVEKMLRDVSRCAPGSVIGFDYITMDLLHQMERVTRWIGEGMYFGLAEDGLEPLLEKCGLQLVEHCRPEALQARFGPRQADGRYLLDLGNFGGLAIAGVGVS